MHLIKHRKKTHTNYKTKRNKKFTEKKYCKTVRYKCTKNTIFSLSLHFTEIVLAYALKLQINLISNSIANQLDMNKNTFVLLSNCEIKCYILLLNGIEIPSPHN